ncbi:divalent metal cation transporter [Ramlibacter sp.]|uniref:divalent metal cation transporter n=1 Tax=Ramlibacter sp. TaxID=1917967 RepID=UPI002FCC12E2
MLLTALDVFLLLYLFDRGVRTLEAVTFALVLLIGGCFAYNLALAQPELGAVLSGILPKGDVLSNGTMLWLAVGIVGATVMPHNLYLHSSLVRTREVGPTEDAKRTAIACATIDSTGALLFALFINGSILVLSAATFFTRGYNDVTELQQAHQLIAPVLGASGAAVAFAVALLASGFASTVTATLAGQVVMEGFLHRTLPPWVRRFATRAIAIVPAMVITAAYGESGTATLLIASQVVLSLQLPFALVPLVRFTTSRAVMGNLAAPRWLGALAWACCSVIVLLNLTMLASLLFSH